MLALFAALGLMACSGDSATTPATAGEDIPVDEPTIDDDAPGIVVDPLAGLSEGDWVVPGVLPDGYEMIVAFEDGVGGPVGGRVLVGGDDVAEVTIWARTSTDQGDSDAAEEGPVTATEAPSATDETVDVAGIEWRARSIVDDDGVVFAHWLERDVNGRIVMLETIGERDVLIALAAGLVPVPDDDFDVARLSIDDGEFVTVAKLDEVEVVAHGVNGVYCVRIIAPNGSASGSCSARTEPRTPVVAVISGIGPDGSFTAGVAEADVARIEFVTDGGDSIAVEPAELSGTFEHRFWITAESVAFERSGIELAHITYDNGTTTTAQTSAVGWRWVLAAEGEQPQNDDADPAAPPDPGAEPPADLAAALVGWNWEFAGIGRVCGDVWWQQQQLNQRRCTQVVVDPQGIPVSYDPLDRRVTRERREGTEPVAFTLSEEYIDASLLAAGPDDVVYFALDNDWPSPSDVIAVSLTAGDTGRLIERFSALLPIFDADVLAAPTGLVVSGWYDQGPRPSLDAPPVVTWVSRDGDTPSPIPLGAFDDANNLVQAHNWQWRIDDRQVIAEQPGMSAVMPTFDGGFIATYSETTGGMRTELIRGWRDGTVEYVELPLDWTALDGQLVLEPQGTLLVPNGDRFARLAPFEHPATGWDPDLRIDIDAGTVTPVGLDDYLDTIDWPISGQSHVWPWGTSPITFANAVAGPPSSPAELRTIHQESVEDSIVVVTVTTEGFLDDSGHGTRLVMRISLDQPGFRIERIDWASACQPNRGHQDYQASPCR